jgi:hypothetical protein
MMDIHEIVKLPCNHELCIDCRDKIHASANPKCPFCRRLLQIENTINTIWIVDIDGNITASTNTQTNTTSDMNELTTGTLTGTIVSPRQPNITGVGSLHQHRTITLTCGHMVCIGCTGAICPTCHWFSYRTLQS